MTLSADQLAQIEAFIRKRGFNEVEVVQEVLDHVACRVEETLTAAPALDFEAALRHTHAEFGVFGFATLAESIEARIGREVTRRYLILLRGYLTTRQVLIPILVGVLGWQVSGWITAEVARWFLLAPFLGMALLALRAAKPWRTGRSITLQRCMQVGFPSGYLFYWAGIGAETAYFPALFALALAQWTVGVLASLDLMAWARARFQSTYQTTWAS
jgi:hypothetical protein